MTRRSRLTAAGFAVLLAYTGLACGGGNDTSTTPVAKGVVKVVDNAFSPKTVHIAAGDTVTWRWAGSVKHNVTGPGFSSPTQKNGEYTHTFEEAGTFAYVCTLHSGMKGKVEVS